MLRSIVICILRVNTLNVSTKLKHALLHLMLPVNAVVARLVSLILYTACVWGVIFTVSVGVMEKGMCVFTFRDVVEAWHG